VGHSTLATNPASRRAARGNNRRLIYLLLQLELAALNDLALWRERQTVDAGRVWQCS